MERSIESFMAHQVEAEKRFQEYEDERWKREVELEDKRRQEDRDHEDKRRQEDRDHEMRMMHMLGQMYQRNNYHGYTPNTGPAPGSGPYDF